MKMAKKLMAVAAASVLTLNCMGMAVSADSVYTTVSVDAEALKELLGSFGVAEKDQAFVDPVLEVVNALGIDVTTLDDGVELRLDLNGNEAATVGCALDEQGVRIASTLFPNFEVNMSMETLNGLLEQAAAGMPIPGFTEGSGPEMEALGKVVGDYAGEFIEACGAAAVPGEAETGEYDFYGYTFDVKVPMTIDMPKIKTALDEMIDKLLAEESFVSMLESSLAYSGASYDEEKIREAITEFEDHFPAEVSVEYYGMSDNSPEFYTLSNAFNEGSEEPAYISEILYDGETAEMSVTDEADGMEIGFTYAPGGISMDFTMGDMYFGLGLGMEGTDMYCDLYFMNPDSPLASINVSVSKGGERTLSMDGAGKGTVSAEELMGGEATDAVNSLMQDIMNNGLGSLMNVLNENVPDVAAIVQSFFEGGKAA